MAKRFETIDHWRIEGLVGVDLDMNVAAKGRPWRVHVYPLQGTDDNWSYKRVSFEGQEKAKERFELFRNSITALVLEGRAVSRNIWEVVDGQY